MNAGQIIMSMMQEVTKSAVPDVAVSAGGAQMPGEGGFADLLVALQTEAQLFQRVPETGSEPVLSEPEPVMLQSEGVADLTRNCPEVSNAGAQMILAAYAQPARMPGVTDQPDHDVDMLQNVAETRQTAQPSVTLAAVAAKMGLKQFDEPAPAQFNVPEATVSSPATSLKQDGRMPIVNTSPGHDVDAVQNAQKINTDTADQKQFTVSEQQPARPSATVEMSSKTVETSMQPQMKVPSQQDARMPAVNNSPGHEVDTLQNVVTTPLVPKAEQAAFTAVAAPRTQAFVAAQAADEQQLPRQAADVAVVPKNAGAAFQRQPSAPSQQEGRMPSINTLPGQKVDSAQKVPSAVQTLEDISFSLTRPVTVSKSIRLESNQVLQPAAASGAQIILLDMDLLQSGAAGNDSASVLPEGTVSVRHQDIGKVSSTPNVTEPNPLSTRKEQAAIVMPGTSSGSLSLPPEADTVVRETVDIQPAAQQQRLHNPPLQPAADTHNENDRPSNTTVVTKETLLSQQGMTSVSEAALTPDDSMGSGNQSGTGQNPDNQMLAHQLHGQSKSEHHNVAALSSDTVKPEQSGQELPERVAHQVRERLNQHEVKQGSQQITLTLSPENLGELKMSLNLQGQRLSVEILTENRLVRDAILQHSDSLKDSLARQNIAVESFDVTANGRGSGNSGHNQDAWKELARQKQQQHFWGSNGGYHPAPLESQTNPLAYRAGNEQAMLDIHY